MHTTLDSFCPDFLATAAGRGCPVDYDELVEALHAVARRIEAEDAGAEPALRALMGLLGEHADPRCVGLYVFAAALARRLAGAAVEQANLYLTRFEMPQIHLFNLLGRAVPFVGLATRIGNEALMQAITGQARPTVIDVGIGTGRQIGVLLESLAAAGKLPRLLTVIGIEPSAWALEEARQHIEQTATRLGADVSFFGVAVLRHLRALNPALLVLAEPDVDHLERGFYRRFSNCMAHFGAVFRTLDRLPLAQADRDALKVGFFGREIADILGSPEAQRSKRHESAAQWLRRLDAAGFELGVPGTVTAQPACAVRIVHHAGHLSLDAIDEPVVAIFTAAPRPAQPASAALAAESASC